MKIALMLPLPSNRQHLGCDDRLEHKNIRTCKKSSQEHACDSTIVVCDAAHKSFDILRSNHHNPDVVYLMATVASKQFSFHFTRAHSTEGCADQQLVWSSWVE